MKRINCSKNTSEMQCHNTNPRVSPADFFRRKHCTVFLALIMILVLPLAAFSQAVIPEEPAPEAPPPAPAETGDRVLLAISSDSYPVIPGDVYRLTYHSAGEEISNEIRVNSNYQLNLNIFGTIDTKGKTYQQVKAEAENLIARAYPNSLPALNLISVGLFEVIVRGAIPQTAFPTAWGLSRLSDVVEGNLAVYSSRRDIRITSRDGTERVYDLLKALRGGDQRENPYIRPGDVINISRAERVIEIRGQVYRPGYYQLLPGEGIEEFEFFSGGLTQNADISRVKLERNQGSRNTIFYLDLEQQLSMAEDASGRVRLQHGDTLTVPPRTDTMPVVFFEGAVQREIPAAAPEAPAGPAGEAPAAAAGGPTYGRLTYPFSQGETLFNALTAIRGSITSTADLSQAYILRQGTDERIVVNLEQLLYEYSQQDDIQLHPFDRIVIPSSNYDIYISGEVSSPGLYPYVPEKRFGYYTNLAGGLDIAGNTSSQVSIFDANGNRRERDEVIMPGDRIFVHPNSNIVTVNGAVVTPGTYEFIPQERYTYYVSRAGGVDFERSATGDVTVYAMNGKQREANEYIQPGDRVYVHSDAFLYNFNRYFPIITTGLSFVTAVIGLVNLLSGD